MFKFAIPDKHKLIKFKEISGKCASLISVAFRWILKNSSPCEISSVVGQCQIKLFCNW